MFGESWTVAVNTALLTANMHQRMSTFSFDIINLQSISETNRLHCFKLFLYYHLHYGLILLQSLYDIHRA